MNDPGNSRLLEEYGGKPIAELSPAPDQAILSPYLPLNRSNSTMLYSKHLIVSVVGVTALGSAVALQIFTTEQGPPPAPVTCPASSCAIYAVGIDPSDADKLTDLQKDILKQKLKEELPGKFKSGDNIVVFMLTGDSLNPHKRIFEMTYPTFSSRFDVLDKSIEDLKNEDRAKLEEFLAGYTSAIDEALKPRSIGISPIVEGMNDFAKWLNAQPAQNKHVLVASDFLQNSQVGSAYETGFGTQDVGEKPVTMKDTKLGVIYLSRRSERQHQNEEQRGWAKRRMTAMSTGEVDWKEM